ncbi:hypothetical protein P280DRAFT_480720 [Massarina eburnea CBS 473.64]|uniref:BRCT domain-containing protein n=1 Tax=Massarina eburnea CBS 473.64 TaxID=1395130 RepID=A0A6A6RY17_9PLEO|nr:hypothetical protein P280DRAFT_480720 [Massarina eburnea CBS 473.64]
MHEAARGNPMSSHLSSTSILDDDLPPPSAQRAARVDAEVRTSAARPIPARGDVDRVAVATLSQATSSRTLTVHPAAADLGTSMVKELKREEGSGSRRAAAAAAAAAAAPVRHFVDPWNSSSTGHQRAENRLSGSTSWRQSRSLKLGEQFRGGLTGGKRVADTVGVGSGGFGEDGRMANGGWEKGAKGLRTEGQTSLMEAWARGRAVVVGTGDKEKSATDDLDEIVHVAEEPSPKPQEKQIFRGLCFYLNGSTAPLISDHKLKHLLSLHGATHSIGLARRTVTHVILSTTCGGGLAASKMQKEITKTRGKSVKFVTADW